jgi:hypothetical protein
MALAVHGTSLADNRLQDLPQSLGINLNVDAHRLPLLPDC